MKNVKGHRLVKGLLPEGHGPFNPKGDGNCYFRCIAGSLSRFRNDENKHEDVRRLIVRHIRDMQEHDEANPLLKYYNEQKDMFDLENLEEIADRLESNDGQEGWGGYDISSIVANALNIEIVFIDSELFSAEIFTPIQSQPGQPPLERVILFREDTHFYGFRLITHQTPLGTLDAPILG